MLMFYHEQEIDVNEPFSPVDEIVQPYKKLDKYKQKIFRTWLDSSFEEATSQQPLNILTHDKGVKPINANILQEFREVYHTDAYAEVSSKGHAEGQVVILIVLL